MNARLRTGAVALLAAVLLAHQAAAMDHQGAATMEEVVVYGTDLSVKTERIAERIFAAMTDYVAELNKAQKRRLDAELAKSGEHRIQIAAAKLPTRG